MLKMTKRMTPVVLLIFAIVSGAACSMPHQVVPVPQPIDDESLPRLGVASAIAVEPLPGMQSKEFELCSAGPHSYTVTSAALTKTAISVTREVLRHNGIEVNPDSVKKLRIRAVDSRCSLEKMVYRHVTTINVHAGDSIVKNFSGSRSVGHVFSTSFAVEMTINQAVLEMFKDRQILDYLQN